MRLQEFPNCCTAKVLTGLGFAPTAGYCGNNYNTDEEFYNRAKELIEGAAREGKALIFAITVHHQERAIRVLPKLGFVVINKNVDKAAHLGVKLTSWVYQCTGEDARPLPIPANPFTAAKPKAPVAQLVGAEVQAGVRALQQARPRILRFTMTNGAVQEGFLESDRERIKEWYEMGTFIRQKVNDHLWRENRRDEMGRYRALPTRGKMYSFAELRNLFIPAGARYRRMTRWEGRERYNLIASITTVPQLGIVDTEINRNSAGFVFA